MTLQLWLLILGSLFLTGAIFHINWLIAASTAVMVFMGLAEGWKRWALKGVSYRRKWVYRRGFPGERTQVRVEVQNRKWLPLSWLRVSDPWPRNAGIINREVVSPSHLPEQDTLVNMYSLRWNERISRSYEIGFRQRGVYPVGPATIESGDLFGLYETSQTQPHPEYLTVFPEILSLADLGLPTDDPFGDKAARRRLFEDPNRPMGVRSYHPEDEFRRIHWPATARTGSLQVKVYQPVTSRVMVVCANIQTNPQPWLGTNTDLMEQVIKVSATMVYHGIQSGYSVGLVSNGCLAHADQPFRIPPGRSPDQLARLLMALAAVTPYATAQFEDFLVKSMPQVPYGATLLVISGLVTTTLCETLLRLKRYRAHITLVSLQSDPTPVLPGIQTMHLPYVENTEDTP